MNTTSLFTPIIKAFGRYHFTIFIVVLASGLAVAVLTLNSILEQPADANGYKSSLDITSFDQATIDRVTKLRSSSDAPPEFVFPSGRTNPFAE